LSPRRNFETAQLIGVAAFVVALDQWTKAIVLEHVALVTSCWPACENTRPVIPGWLNIAPIPNYHGAFGLFGNSPFLLVLMALIVLLIFWYSFRDQAHESLFVRIAFGMILGGAVGNIIDRVRFNYVVDFIDFNRFPQIWRYTFNVADACITVGVMLLILASLVRRRHA
jgi:signal peptidase II